MRGSPILDRPLKSSSLAPSRFITTRILRWYSSAVRSPTSSNLRSCLFYKTRDQKKTLMTELETHKTFSLGYLTGILAVLLLGSCIANADDKKPAPAKAAPKPAATRSAPATGAPKGP